MNITQTAKDWLVSLGPDNPLVRLALRLYGMPRGFRIDFSGERITIAWKEKRMVLARSALYLVPIMMEAFDFYFSTMEPTPTNGLLVLDFSGPGLHKYTESRLEFTFPGIPEDEGMEAYTYKFKPAPGMVVFDVGAHAGLTTYSLAKFVGEQGRVHAFEPDDLARQYLLENIRRHALINVIVTDAAMADHTGHAAFNMDGTVGAGLVEFLVYKDTGKRKEVPAITLEDYCKRIGQIPNFIKMDVEGGELAIIEASLPFLRKNPIHFAFDSYHRTREGTLTYHELERLFRSIGYGVESSDRFRWMYTWATPPSSGSIP